MALNLSTDSGIDLALPVPGADTRVVVAMSGGVDSSVVAGLVKAAGYDVIGITLQLYDHGEAVHRSGACCAGQDIHDARRVAEMLDIPHYVLDYESRFQSAVIEPFTESYLSGETPIPCVICNQTVKFADLLATAKQLDAAALATGHYVRSARNGDHMALYRPVDLERDQSYFLYGTTQEQLDFLRFPLGSMTKTETRDRARAMGLDIADKSDSQDICFVPQGRYTDVIEKLRPNAVEAGNIVHIDGRVLGRHEGIIHFTIGQRRGLGIAADAPLYVVRLDADQCEVIVGPREALAVHRIRLRDFNWLGDGSGPELPETPVHARVRSTRPPVAGYLAMEDGYPVVHLSGDERGVAKGQACVLYDSGEAGARVLGGGTIAETSGAIEANAA